MHGIRMGRDKALSSAVGNKNINSKFKKQYYLVELHFRNEEGFGRK